MTFFSSREATNTDRQTAEPFNTKWASFCAALMGLWCLHRSVLLDCKLKRCPFASEMRAQQRQLQSSTAAKQELLCVVGMLLQVPVLKRGR